MSPVKPSKCTTTTGSQLTDCMQGGRGGTLWNTPRPQAVKHKGLLLYPVQIIINLTVYETHCEGGRLQPIQEQIVHPVRNLTYSIIKSLQPGLIHSPPLSNTSIREWATIVYRLSIIVCTKMIPGLRKHILTHLIITFFSTKWSSDLFLICP